MHMLGQLRCHQSVACAPYLSGLWIGGCFLYMFSSISYDFCPKRQNQVDGCRSDPPVRNVRERPIQTFSLTQQ